MVNADLGSAIVEIFTPVANKCNRSIVCAANHTVNIKPSHLFFIFITFKFMHVHHAGAGT